MDFPNIISELIDDPVIWDHRTALKIYKILRQSQKIYYEPEPVKVGALAHLVKAKKSTVISGIRLLIERGYMVECGRDERGVRQLMLNRTRVTKSVVPAEVAQLPVPQTGPIKKPRAKR